MNSSVSAELFIMCVLLTRGSVILSEPVFDAHNYPDVWVVWVLLSHFTDEEIEVNGV